MLKLFIKLASKSKKFNTMHKKLDLWLNKKFFKYKNSDNNLVMRKKWFLLMLFTAVPLPFSGVWSACLLATFLNMNFFGGFLAILEVALFPAPGTFF